MNKIYNLLFEEERVDTPETSMNMPDSKLKARKALDSVDDQIDALILRYEASSIREGKIGKANDGLMESLMRSNLKYLLEQDTPEAPGEALPDAPEAPDAAEDSGPPVAPEPVGSEKMEVEEPGEEMTPDLDIDAFAARSVRLIVNHKSLLRIEEAIGNRIKNFLDENYGEKFVKRYIEILENQYGIALEEFKDERQTTDDNFAVGAYAGGTGGLGGGGG